MRTGLKLGSMLLCATAFFQLAEPAIAAPIGTAFTYQGRLQNGGRPLDGTADLEFRLFTLAIGGAQVGPTVTLLNQTIEDGLFTVQLDFGSAAFDGNGLWLQIAVEGVTLSPRQQLTATPFALWSTAPWRTSGTSVFYSDGSVGIGTSSPNADLDIEGTDVSLRLNSTNANGTSTLDLRGDSPTGLSSNVLGALRFLGDGGVVAAQLFAGEGFLANPFNFEVNGAVEMVLTDNGNLGVGTTLPLTKVQIDGGTDSEPAEGGYLVIGNTAGANLSFDNNEIMARNDGATATLFLNNDGGDVSILPAGGGQVGIGTPASGAAQLTVFNSLFVNGGAQPRLDIGSNGFILMGNNADITITNGGLEVNTPSGGATFFNRTFPDGTLISFLNDGASAGGISVAGNTVIYTTFTGAHNAWTATPIEAGSLVKLTGENRRDHTGPNSEPTYGIALTTFANDPACMGSYLSEPDLSNPGSQHLVASVGNGEMWVVDDGRGNIEAGDYLISSDVPGTAMLDDTERFGVGHVIARAAEAVDWSTVKANKDGSKRALVSVFYESFDRQGNVEEMARMAETIEQQREELAELRAKVESLEALSARLAAMEAQLSGAVQVQKGRNR